MESCLYASCSCYAVGNTILAMVSVVGQPQMKPWEASSMTLCQAFLRQFSGKHLVINTALLFLSGSFFGYFNSLALNLVSSQLADFIVFNSGLYLWTTLLASSLDFWLILSRGQARPQVGCLGKVALFIMDPQERKDYRRSHWIVLRLGRLFPM